MKERSSNSSSSSGGGGSSITSSSSSKLTLVSIHEICLYNISYTRSWGCKGFPLKTGFCYVQVPFITGFILHDMLLLFVMCFVI